MSDPATLMSDSEELLYMYITLRKLQCIQIRADNKEKKTAPLETSLFPRRFILKQLNERLEDLDAFAADICDDLFRQVSGQPKRTEANGPDNHFAIDPFNETIRYPEFDEYFHFCLHQLHDFMIGLNWHEIDISHLSKSDSAYVAKNLEFVGYLIAFQSSLVDLIWRGNTKSPASLARVVSPKPTQDATITSDGRDENQPRAGAKKSNLRASPEKRESPQARRRVRFKNLPPEIVSSDDQSRYKIEQNDLADNHSVFALDLLIYAINMYIQRLADTLIVWSASVQNELNQVIDLIFDSKLKVRSKQLQVIAKKIKIYNDVHLTVLDHLGEIKRTYLIKHVRGTLLSRDSTKLITDYKSPRLKVYIQRIGVDVEEKILSRLAKQSLQIFFNLIVCEINFSPFELKKTKSASKDEKVRSQENITNFISNWFKVDHVFFGYNKARQPSLLSQETDDRLRAETLLKQIKRPQLVAKTSTLSLNDKYASSSRILAQMDNLSEFMREFLHLISERLSYEQQLKFFLETISVGLMQIFETVAPKLEQQLLDIKSRERPRSPQRPETATTNRKGGKRTPSPADGQNIELLLVKIRCMKFIHVIGATDRIVANEAARAKVELGGDLELDLKLARFAQVCMDSSKFKE